MADLKDKVVIITGASAGIGEGIALEFAKLGSKLVLTGRNVQNLSKVADQCISLGLERSKILCVDGDIASESLRKSLVEKTKEKFGRIDVLVNNAGLSYLANPMNTSEEKFDEMMDVNVKAVFFLTQLAIPHLTETKGNIVNISSIAGEHSSMNLTAYSMSKAALDMYTRCLSIELGPSGIRANAVSPGTVYSMIGRRGESPLVDENLYQLAMDNEARKNPLKKMGHPVDIAKAVVFLASNEQASFVSGEIMRVDGARHNTSIGVSD